VRLQVRALTDFQAVTFYFTIIIVENYCSRQSYSGSAALNNTMSISYKDTKSNMLKTDKVKSR